eukprot:CFRG4787T1
MSSKHVQTLYNALKSLTAKKALASKLRFRSFFVAWDGVIVVVYNGFTSELEELKEYFQLECGDILRPENHGSRWPKTTLGAINSDSPHLSLDELRRLRMMCLEYNKLVTNRYEVLVDSISLVEFQTRNLEKIFSKKDIALPDNGKPPSSQVLEDAQETVNSVLSQFFDSTDEAYLPFLETDKNRSCDYRKDNHGVTMVHFLGALSPEVAAFRNAIDFALPGRYDWFTDESLHITVRSCDAP